MPASLWDKARWDAGTWSAPAAPGAGWGTDWEFWWQVGSVPVHDLTAKIVEARWTTDSHAQADGTYRGNVQPGKCAVRLWDPDHVMETCDKYGALWASYKPTGATFAWFYNTLSRGLYAPGDRASSDCVFQGDTWPLRLTANTWTAYSDTNNRPVEPANTRLNNLVDTLVAGPGGYDFQMPAITKTIAAQTQQIPAITYAGAGPPWPSWPAWLTLVRDAATDGIAWWSYGRAPNGAGTMGFRYDRWEANNQRALDPAQIVAGPPVDMTAGFVYGFVDANATRAADGVNTYQRYAGNMAFAGAGNIGVALYGDIGTPSSPDWNGANGTVSQMAADHSDPTERVLSTMTAQSGRRLKTDGSPSSSTWDPAAHVWTPLDVAAYADPVDNKTHYYRVQKTDHILNAALWQTVLTLEKYSAATPLA